MQNFLDGARNIKGANHNDYAFVGFHDRFVEGEYLTVFGKTAPLFSVCIFDTRDFRSSLRSFQYSDISSCCPFASRDTHLHENKYLAQADRGPDILFVSVQFSIMYVSSKSQNLSSIPGEGRYPFLLYSV